MPEPISMILGAAALGGAAGKVVEKAWDAGEHWIGDYLGKHGEEVQARARDNTLEFLGDLAARLAKVEKAVSTTALPDSDMRDRLSDPDFAATMQSAIISSARTSNREKHKVLAELVTARLEAAPDTMRAITATIAVDVVPRLNPKHLELLGLILVLYQVRPGRHAALGSEEANAQGLEWLARQSRLFPLAFSASSWDAVYLDGLGCIQQMPSIMEIPMEKLYPGIVEGPTAGAQMLSFLTGDPDGIRIRALWHEVLHRAVPTPVGTEVGNSVYSSRTGE